MRNLIEIKELLKRLYSKYEVYILPALKCILTFIVLSGINGQLGFMSKINNIAIVLIVSLLCSFLPVGFIVFFAAVFILLHLYSLALEVALVCFCIFLIMFLVYFRFTPKDALVVLLTPICFGLRIPYVMPIAMGLVGTPVSAVSIACGTAVYYLIRYIAGIASTINGVDAAESTAKLRMVIDGIINNKEMLITVAAFIFTVLFVYIIRRLSVDHSWTIAIVSGCIVNVVILLLGDFMYDTNVSVIGVLIGTIVSVFIAFVLQFFVFSVDYSRTEKVQFEDDEYYYYVKAVPKMTVAAPDKTVKRINVQTVRTSHQSNLHQPARTPSNNGRYTPGRQAASRTISTENTDNPDDFGEN